MRRLIDRFLDWCSRPPKPGPFVEYEPLRPQHPREVIIDPPMDVLLNATPAPLPVSSESQNGDIVAVCEAIIYARQQWHACWPIDLDAPPPVNPQIHALNAEMAREAVASQATGLLAYTARHVPLMRGMDAEAMAEWHPLAQLCLRTAYGFLSYDLRNRLGMVRIVDASLTIYAPRAWVANKPLRTLVERRLLAAVSSALGVQVNDLIRAIWEESDGPFFWDVELWDSADWQEVAA